MFQVLKYNRLTRFGLIWNNFKHVIISHLQVSEYQKILAF